MRWNIYNDLKIPLIYLTVILAAIALSIIGSMIGSMIVPDPTQVAISP